MKLKKFGLVEKLLLCGISIFSFLSKTRRSEVEKNEDKFFKFLFIKSTVFTFGKLRLYFIVPKGLNAILSTTSTSFMFIKTRSFNKIPGAKCSFIKADKMIMTESYYERA